ncbi:MAG: DUF393 domain-containing protein [Bryobacterales bacterium]|nr:DUF393 domain-containing protein [Bryobacterales bacterium]
MFFDRDCGFCRRSVAAVRALDWFRSFRFVPLQGEEAKALGLAESRNLSQMVFYRNGRQWGGWRAVKRTLFRLPLSYAAGGALALTALLAPGWRAPAVSLALFAAAALSPLGNPAGDALYRWVARNRRCLPGASCPLTSRGKEGCPSGLR